MGGHLMAYRWLRSPKALVFTPIVLLLLALVACGSTAPAEPVVVEKEVIKEIVKEVENRFVVTRAASTAVLATPTKQSALDCQVTGSATVNRRPSVEYLLGVDHTTGEITNMLAKEWEASDDHVRST